MVAMLMTVSHANAALKESTKPSKVIIYLEEAMPFSGFNMNDDASGMLAEYWTDWSKETDISIEFRPYASQKLNHLLKDKQPAIYSGFNLRNSNPDLLHSTAFMQFSSHVYYLSQNSPLSEESMAMPITVGGLLSKAKNLPFFKNNPNIEYKEYEGVLDLIVDLYFGDIDAFVMFRPAYSPISLSEELMSKVLNRSSISEQSNSLYAYATLDNQNLLAWIKWGSDKDELKLQLNSLLSSVSAAEWSTSGLAARYLFIFLSVITLIILIRFSKRKKDQQFKNLLDSSPYPLVICSLDGKALFYTNDEAKSLFPFKKMKKTYKFEEEENQVLLSRFINKVSHQSVIEAGIIRLLVGTKFYDIEISAKRIHHGRESAWLCYLKNVTDLLKAQSNLTEERALLRKVLDSIPEQIHFKSIKGQIIGCNEVWAKVNHTTVQKATGINESEVQEKDQLKRAHQQESSVWAGETFKAQEWVQQKDGQMSLMNITKVPLHNDKGTVFSILSIASEITALHNLNEQLKEENIQRKETEKALSTQNVLIKSIFDSAKDPIGLLDEDGVILGANNSFIRFMGVSADDIVGASQKDLLPYERADWSERQNKEVIELGKSITFEEFVFFEGEEIWYEVHKTPFIDEDSDLRGIVVMARDITTRKNKELQLTSVASEFEHQSLNDQLTNIANRRSFDETIEKYWKVASQNKTPLSLVMCDIDFFKPYNDTYGHQKGDDTLQRVAAVLQRKCDEYGCFVARYGGEEFVLLIQEESATHALRIAEDIRKAVEEEEIDHPKSVASLFVTLSMGMATHLPSDGTNSRGLIKEADNALYEAKSTGRNQVQVA